MQSRGDSADAPLLRGRSLPTPSPFKPQGFNVSGPDSADSSAPCSQPSPRAFVSLRLGLSLGPAQRSPWVLWYVAAPWPIKPQGFNCSGPGCFHATEKAQRTPRAVHASGPQPQWAGFTGPQISRGAQRHRCLLRYSAPRSGALGLLEHRGPLADQAPGLQSQWARLLACDKEGTSQPLRRSSLRASMSVGQFHLATDN